MSKELLKSRWGNGNYIIIWNIIEIILFSGEKLNSKNNWNVKTLFYIFAQETKWN